MLPPGSTGIREGFLEKVTATLRPEGYKSLQSRKAAGQKPAGSGEGELEETTPVQYG